MVNAAGDRAGRGKLGCLIWIVLFVFAGYVVAQFLPPWMRYERFHDAMRSESRFAVGAPDSMIRMRLIAQADSLGLPAAAKRITIRRHLGRPPTVLISAEYSEEVKLPIFGVKVLHFKPKAEEPL